MTKSQLRIKQIFLPKHYIKQQKWSLKNFQADKFLKNRNCNPFFLLFSSTLSIRAFFCICCAIYISFLCFERLFLCSLRVHFFTKIQIIRIFRWEKKRCIQKGLFFIHFRRNYPQYRRYPGERITRLLNMLRVWWSFIVFSTVSFRILLYTGQMKTSLEIRYVLKK